MSLASALVTLLLLAASAGLALRLAHFYRGLRRARARGPDRLAP